MTKQARQTALPLIEGLLRSLTRLVPARVAPALVALALAGPAAAAYQFNFPPPATSIAQDVYDMHIWMTAICLVIFVIVFGAMFYAVARHRKALGRTPATFHENTKIEALWTIVPFIILVLMAWPITKTLLAMRDTSDPDLTIKVTGYQWKWGYDYLVGEGEGIKFQSVLATPPEQIRNEAAKGENYLLEVDNHMVVPVNKKVRLLTTANDVIHAWYVPALAVKQDTVPGFIRDTWFRAEREGIYRGQCAELCGTNHGYMPIVVEVVSPEKYTAWVGQQKTRMSAAAAEQEKAWSMADLMKRGEEVYLKNCAACHQANGKGIAGTFPPLDGARIATGDKREHMRVVMQGRPGTAMPGFAAQLSDVDIAAVTTYERNAWSNRAGDLVQPAEIRAARR